MIVLIAKKSWRVFTSGSTVGRNRRTPPPPRIGKFIFFTIEFPKFWGYAPLELSNLGSFFRKKITPPPQTEILDPPLVLDLRKYDHIIEALCSLHWLPIRYRIKYKIGLITFKVLKFNEPECLADLLIKNIPSRTLRSSHSNTINTPRTRLKLEQIMAIVLAHHAYGTNYPTTDVISCETVEQLKGN